MDSIKKWESIIQEKRKHTPFREFVKEVASWFPIAFYRYEDGTIGKFPKEKVRVRHPVTSPTFHGLRDGLMSYGVDYNGDLFRGVSDIFANIPIEALKQFDGTINTEYADIALGKNIYLTVVWFDSENIAYSLNIKDNCRNVYNSVLVWEHCENIYSSRYVTASFNVFYSQYVHSSQNIWLSSDLVGCQECIRCSGLKNAKYCIDNLSYEKEEYEKKKREYLSKKHSFAPTYRQIIERATESEVTNYQCEEVENGLMNYRVKTGRNVVFVGAEDSAERMYDVASGGILPVSDFYAVMGAGIGSDNLYCSVEIIQSSHIYYSYLLEACSFCIGCIGLKNKSYCILNRQYSQEEWYELANRIFGDMDQNGALGEFFPGSVNPFYFNDTLASFISSDFTKEEIIKDGYLWRDAAINADIPEGIGIVGSRELDVYQGFDAKGIWQINPEIQKKVIADAEGNHYRIIQMEYDFLVKHSLPLPTDHWLDRIKLGCKMQ